MTLYLGNYAHIENVMYNLANEKIRIHPKIMNP